MSKASDSDFSGNAKEKISDEWTVLSDLLSEVDHRRDICAKLYYENARLSREIIRVHELNSRYESAIESAEDARLQLEERRSQTIRLIGLKRASWRDKSWRIRAIIKFRSIYWEKIIDNSHLFDRIWYRSHYKVPMSFARMERHFLHIGNYKGYNPSPGFDTVSYYMNYPDVAESGACALLHYITYGRAEGRVFAAPHFDSGWSASL